MGWEKALSSLFAGSGSPAQLSARDQALREIYESVFTLWHQHPARSDQQMAQWVEERYGRTKRQALQDIAVVKSALGNIQHAAKEWQRYRVLEMLAHAYQVAEATNDVPGMVRAAAQIGRFTLLDKPEDPAPIPWDEMASPDFEPSADPALLGLAGAAGSDAARARLERRYGLQRGADTPPGAPAPENPYTADLP